MQASRPFFACLVALLLAACEPIVLDPADPLENTGPYAVRSSNAAFASATTSQLLRGSWYYPAGSHAPASLPLVVITHGFSLSYDDYSLYSRHLASHGFVVLGFDFVDTGSNSNDGRHNDKARQLSEAIDHALADGPLAASINPAQIAAMGHSLGGKIAFLAAADDARIAAIVALDPSNAGGPPCFIAPDYCARYPAAPNPSRSQVGVLSRIQAASLIFRSRPDVTNPAEEFNARYFYYGDDGAGNNGVPAPAFYINLDDAAHASYAPLLPSVVPALVKRNSLAWLQQQFFTVDRSDYFTGSIMQRDINAGRVKGYASREL